MPTSRRASHIGNEFGGSVGGGVNAVYARHGVQSYQAAERRNVIARGVSPWTESATDTIQAPERGDTQMQEYCAAPPGFFLKRSYGRILGG